MASGPLLRRRPSRLWSVDMDREAPTLSKRQSKTGVAASDSSSSGGTGAQGDRSSLLQKHTDRRNSVWGAITNKDAPEDEDALLHALEEFTEFGQDGIAEEPDLEAAYSEEEKLNQQLIEAHFDVKGSALRMRDISKTWLGAEEESSKAALTSGFAFNSKEFKGHDPRLSMKVARKWGWFVCTMLHLRIADSAEQHDSILAGDDSVGSNSLSQQQMKPTRRATLFGSVMGVYRTATQDQMINLFHCVGEDMLRITQDLRVKKSNQVHRAQKKPLMYFEDIRPEDSETPKSSRSGKRSTRSRTTAGKPLDGLLAALSAAKKKNDKAAQERRQIRNMTLNAEAVEHLHVVQEEHRQHRLKERMHRVHDTMEFYQPRPKEMLGLLREHYDPENMSYPTNMFYSPRNLLKREALRFDPDIQFLLRTIWKASDVDESGGIDRIEYFEMHSRITCALIGRGAGDSMMRIFLASEDWVADAKGHKTLNKMRLEDCFFTLADRFTSSVNVKEYTSFLNRLLDRIIEYDPETGDVELRLEEDILDMGDFDPLVVNRVFQFKSKEQREKDERKALKLSSSAGKASTRGFNDSDDDLSSNGSICSSPVLSPKSPSSPFGSFDSTGGSFDTTRRLEDDNEADLDQDTDNFFVPKGMLAKYLVCYDFVPEDPGANVQMVLKAHDFIHPEDDLTFAKGSPPDEDGWMFCACSLNNKLKHGYVPNAYLLQFLEVDENYCETESEESSVHEFVLSKRSYREWIPKPKPQRELYRMAQNDMTSPKVGVKNWGIFDFDHPNEEFLASQRRPSQVSSQATSPKCFGSMTDTARWDYECSDRTSKLAQHGIHTSRAKALTLTLPPREKPTTSTYFGSQNAAGVHLGPPRGDGGGMLFAWMSSPKSTNRPEIEDAWKGSLRRNFGSSVPQMSYRHSICAADRATVMGASSSPEKITQRAGRQMLNSFNNYSTADLSSPVPGFPGIDVSMGASALSHGSGHRRGIQFFSG